MKKTQITLALLATLFITLTAFAQGEWKWAHYWSGGDGISYGDYYNQITNTAFDDEGNIYVYGTMGGDAVFDGLTLQYTTHPQVLSKKDRTIILAKFDTLGNMLWHKEMKSDNGVASPRWMEVRNNKVFVAADCGFYGYQSDSWLYYWDTTRMQINSLPQEQQKPPYKAFSRWTCLAQFDLDGNLLEDHFVQTYSRESFFNGSNWLRYDYTLCQTAGAAPTPVHVDNNGNYYIYTPIQYKGTENEPFTIIVDGDSNKTYNLYLPGNTDSENSQSLINNAMLYKFSSSGELLFAKLLIDHTDGIAPTYSTGDSINRYYYTYFKGLSFDEDDNMYLTGYVTLANCLNGHGGELNNYPVHIWWDISHCSTIQDITSANYCNFVIKYDTNGEILWNSQIFTRGDTDTEASAYWNRCTLCDNSLYITGTGFYKPTGNALIYFDSEDNYLQRFQNALSNIGFFVRYDKLTGQYLNHGIIPAEQAVSGYLPAIINNRIFSFSNVNYNYRIISQWRTDGVYIGSDTISSPMPLADGSLIANEGGNLLVNFRANAPVCFDNNVSVNCPSSQSSAVFALYHNPEFTQPFVPDDSVGIDEYYQNREREIYLYPNPTDGHTTVCGYMYGYTGIELYDLQGRKLADLVETGRAPSLQPAPSSSLPVFDLSPYPSGTYLVKINFERGVSVVRKIVRS